MSEVSRGLRAAVARVQRERPGAEIGHVESTGGGYAEVNVAARAVNQTNVPPAMESGTVPGDHVLSLRLDHIQDPFYLGLSPYAAGTAGAPVINL